ncbi:hypothetical protein AEM38_16230 [Hyphomonadaceae bacterium UKL13-1]|nr:hypothetical protein AEM38_16230 [Hyphomonadaceae bacterium UKL13-1]
MDHSELELFAVLLLGQDYAWAFHAASQLRLQQAHCLTSDHWTHRCPSAGSMQKATTPPLKTA